MVRLKKTLKLALALGFPLFALWSEAPLQAQTLVQNRLGFSEVKAIPVEYLFPSQVKLAAGKLGTVTLHFRVANGLHINSHTPKDAFLIPTTFSILNATGVHLQEVNYPPGSEYALPAEPADKLNVYAGEFVLEARIVAAAGHHLVEGKLRFQACDQSACMPPKTISIAMDVLAE